MKNLFWITLLTANIVGTALANHEATPPLEVIHGKDLHPIQITGSEKAKTDWNAQIYLYSIRCPLPYKDWTDKNGWMVILLDKNQTPNLCLETPSGRINDIIIDENRQLAILSLQVDKATPVIYVVSLKQRQVWAADINILHEVYDKRRPGPEKDPHIHYALSAFQLVGLRPAGNTVEGLVRHRSAVNPQETQLSMLIRFSINLDAPQPAVGKPWPITVTKVEDSGQELEWKPTNRDFNPPLAKPE